MSLDRFVIGYHSIHTRIRSRRSEINRLAAYRLGEDIAD